MPQLLGLRRAACRAVALLLVSLAAAPLAHAQTYAVRSEPATAFDTVTTDAVWELVDTGYPIDDDKDEVAIGFTFVFGGVSYTNVRILANGALHFGANQGFHKDYTNEALPITSEPIVIEPGDRLLTIGGKRQRNQGEVDKLLIASSKEPLFVVLRRGQRKIGVLLN